MVVVNVDHLQLEEIPTKVLRRVKFFAALDRYFLLSWKRELLYYFPKSFLNVTSPIEKNYIS